MYTVGNTGSIILTENFLLSFISLYQAAEQKVGLKIWSVQRCYHLSGPLGDNGAADSLSAKDTAVLLTKRLTCLLSPQDTRGHISPSFKEFYPVFSFVTIE